MLSSSKNPPWKALSAFLIKSKLFLYGAAFTLIGRTAVSRIYSRIQPQKAMQRQIIELRKTLQLLVTRNGINIHSPVYEQITSSLTVLDGAVLAISSSMDFPYGYSAISRTAGQIRSSLDDLQSDDPESVRRFTQHLRDLMDELQRVAAHPLTSDPTIHRATASAQ